MKNSGETDVLTIDEGNQEQQNQERHQPPAKPPHQNLLARNRIHASCPVAFSLAGHAASRGNDLATPAAASQRDGRTCLLLPKGGLKPTGSAQSAVRSQAPA
jgi:hypothetical protein